MCAGLELQAQQLLAAPVELQAQVVVTKAGGGLSAGNSGRAAGWMLWRGRRVGGTRGGTRSIDMGEENRIHGESESRAWGTGFSATISFT